MIGRFFFFCLFLGLASLISTAEGSPLDPASQLIVVTTADWNSVSGELQRYEKQGNAFQPVGKPIPIVVGAKGLGWGKGLHLPQSAGLQKKEGDGKAPAGIFDLGKAMGYSSSALSGSTWPYSTSTEAVYCVDDPANASYNQIAELPAGKTPPWKSAEKMRRKDDLYKWLVIVNHNLPEPQAGEGSCVFLHVWRSAEKGTAGCTAMAEENIVEILKWLKPEKKPLLVQLPKGEYEKLKQVWKLP